MRVMMIDVDFSNLNCGVRLDGLIYNRDRDTVPDTMQARRVRDDRPRSRWLRPEKVDREHARPRPNPFDVKHLFFEKSALPEALEP